MTDATAVPDTRSAFTRGALSAAPFILVIVPFGMLFGVVATEAGFDIVQTMAMTSLVIAGAAQFTALQLMTDQAPVFMVILTGLAVNARMAMYSAAMVEHIGKAPLWQRALAAYCLFDQTYGIATLEYGRRPEMGRAEKIAFYFGCALPVCLLWFASSYAGAVVGSAIPEGLALDFAVPITFIALFAPMLRTPAHVAAAAVSILLSLVLAFLPYNLGLIPAALAAMLTGAEVEKRLERRP